MKNLPKFQNDDFASGISKKSIGRIYCEILSWPPPNTNESAAQSSPKSSAADPSDKKSAVADNTPVDIGVSK